MTTENVITKQTREVTDREWVKKDVDVYVETIVEEKTIERSIDALESQITQKQNTVTNLQIEIAELQAKLDEINLL